jgi:hypothetical protein
LHIYRATFTLRTYSDRWKSWVTIVLRKPGKARYDVPKSYRPIALLNTLGKLLSAIVAEDLVYITEKHRLDSPYWPCLRRVVRGPASKSLWGKAGEDDDRLPASGC